MSRNVPRPAILMRPGFSTTNTRESFGGDVPHSGRSKSPSLARAGAAAADAAVEDDGGLAIDRGGLARDLLELDVARALEPPGLPLVVLADVDQLDLAELVAHPLGLHVDVGGVESTVPCHTHSRY